MSQTTASIIVAIISGAITLIGTVLTLLATAKKSEEDLRISRAITNEKIENLTNEVKKHNNFAEKIPALEVKVSNIEKRIDKLEDDK